MKLSSGLRERSALHLILLPAISRGPEVAIRRHICGSPSRSAFRANPDEIYIKADMEHFVTALARQADVMIDTL
jgi:hypothetical protein